MHELDKLHQQEIKSIDVSHFTQLGFTKTSKNLYKCFKFSRGKAIPLGFAIDVLDMIGKLPEDLLDVQVWRELMFIQHDAHGPNMTRMFEREGHTQISGILGVIANGLEKYRTDILEVERKQYALLGEIGARGFSDPIAQLEEKIRQFQSAEQKISLIRLAVDRNRE